MPFVSAELSSPMSPLSSRTRAGPAGPHRTLPSATRRQAAVGTNWIYEIKHDGYRLMARRDPVGIRCLTRMARPGEPLPARTAKLIGVLFRIKGNRAIWLRW